MSDNRKDTDKGDNPYLETVNGRIRITPKGRTYLKKIVTDPVGDVYSFTDAFSPITIAAAMARLSRRGDDMRITILDEFSQVKGRDDLLLQRVITAFGDDSVQQLAGAHVVVEDASNLLTKRLEWGRLAAYLEQSTRYMYYDTRDEDGNYKYYKPKYLEAPVYENYVETMDHIFDLYSVIAAKLTDYVRERSSIPKSQQDGAWRSATRAQACDAARLVLPVAAKSTVGVYGSGQAIESLISHLLSDEMPEAHATGIKILRETRKNLSSFLQRIDIAERGVATQMHRAFTFQAVKQLAARYLEPQTGTKPTNPVTLTSYWPANEMDLLADMLYEHSSLPLKEIQRQVKKWPRRRQIKAFNTYIGDRYNRRHRPGRALEKAHYSWDLLCDYGIFRDLQRHRMVDDLAWQNLTVNYGYDTPELVIEGGVKDMYDRCFELSQKLYDLLQKNNYALESQYATLFGHRMRWKITYNARQAFHFHELRTSPQGHPGYRKLVTEMHNKLSEVHPLIGRAMKFVNKDEDPELTRLAAELATRQKLAKLDKLQAKR